MIYGVYNRFKVIKLILILKIIIKCMNIFYAIIIAIFNTEHIRYIIM